MHCTREIAPNIFWVGGNDRRLELFENMFPLPGGVAYNSYLIMDEKVALLDTVDSAIARQFFENIEHVLGDRSVDYLVVNHMEPDHCANIDELCRRFPGMKIVGNKKTFQMIRQFYDFEFESRTYEVKENDELDLGDHRLRFYFAPMVHWPEVMFTYEERQKILFTADAFGSFGALPGNLFSDEVDFADVFLDESRRYYTNIVGRYGAQVQAALKKVSNVEIRMICPLHGPVWRENMEYILDKYDLWSRYAPEKKGVVLVYASMYGNTENAVGVIANRIAENGVLDMRVYDVSKTHASYIIADAFQYSHLVFASPTYNNGLYFGMEALLRDMAVLNLQNRKVALVGNGSWSPASHTVMEKLILEMKDMELIAPPLVIRSTLKSSQTEELLALADAVSDSVLK
ncbi:MAG TPA: FprA family A-type flavoprotein [Anaerovoracaceae bacterium]|nr:FprA family A-type flavoprotein [Anaerovoracaceae bacterium]